MTGTELPQSLQLCLKGGKKAGSGFFGNNDDRNAERKISALEP